MKTIIELARESGATPYTNRHLPDRPFHTFSPEQLQHFAALIREAVIAELVAGSGEPALLGTKEINMADDLEGIYGYTANQLAGAVLRERERCAQVCDAEATVEGVAQKCAAAIRSGE